MKSISFDIASGVREASKFLIETSTPTVIEYVDLVDLAKNQLPNGLTDAVNIYSIWCRQRTSDKWRLMYIGQRVRASGWNRIREHLFKVGKGTASKLERVREEVCERNAQIGITWIHVEPESMRLAVEDELLRMHSTYINDLPWNTRGTVPPKKRKPSPTA